MITIIGLGEIGLATFKEILKKEDDVLGIDINQELIQNLKSQGLNVSTELPEKSDVYIISVYNSEQVLEVMEKINYDNKPLVLIESTLEPGTIDKINKNCNLVLFPHRYNPDDIKHAVFNLDRILGAKTKEAEEKAIEFYSKFMDKSLIHVFPIEIVELSKPLENAYRFTEIAIAEELKILCEKKGINFEKLREAANTKWNIDIKEARDGIDGKCLPKDTEMINELFKENKIFNNAIKSDKEYQEKAKKR